MLAKESVTLSQPAKLRASQFNAIVENYPRPGRHLVYNTLSQALIELEDAGLELLQSGVRTQEQESLVETLQQKGLLVSGDYHQGEHYLESLESRRHQLGGPVQITLLTTLEPCFLGCVYCYQQGTQNGGKLSTEQSPKILEFIKKQCLKWQASRLWVSYYGSEPLLNTPLIFHTATALHQFSQEERIPFRFGMVTNGVRLTRDLVEQLIPLGFAHAQITIDGNRETHNANRPFKSGQGSYNRILGNLLDYAGLIRTDVLCTLASQRIDAAYELVDTLASHGLAERQVRMQFSPLSPDCFAESRDGSDDRLPEDGRLVVVQAIAELAIYAAERGLVNKVLPQRTWCSMQRYDGRRLAIEPDGTLRTCPALIGRGEKTQAGHIDTGLGGMDLWMQERYHRTLTCIQCCYLPICADCRLDAYASKGSFLAENPQQHVYDRIVPMLIKGQYRLLQKQGGEARTQ